MELINKRELDFIFLAEPSDVNFGGNVHGGSVMKWIDQTAYACAAGWSKNYCVTVYVGGIRFLKPIKIGDIVKVHAKIIFTGDTSIHIAVNVKSHSTTQDEFILNTQCIIIFVALDKAGQIISVPKWIPETEKDKKLEQYAIRLRKLRKEIEQELNSYDEDLLA